MEVSDHVAIDHSDVIDVTEDGLAHHVVAIDVKVDVLHQGFFWILIRCLKLLPDSVFFHLQVIIVVHAVAEHVT